MEGKVKTDLKGLLDRVSTATRKGDGQYGAMYAYCLMELGDHIRGLLRGEHTAEEFADHYCIDIKDTTKWAAGE